MLRRQASKGAGALATLAAICFATQVPGALVKPDLRCGDPIPREQVKVLDVSELPSAELADFVWDQIGGPYEIVKEEKVQANTVFGRAWKKAEKQAAQLGCEFVVLLGSRQEFTGLWTPPNGDTVAMKKDTASVLYLRASKRGSPLTAT